MSMDFIESACYVFRKSAPRDNIYAELFQKDIVNKIRHQVFAVDFRLCYFQ